MKAKPFSISKHIPILFLLFFLGFFAHLGNVPLFDADEGLYTEVTREMLANQDFATVQLNGIPFFHKPPLFFWSQAASIRILGLNEFAMRLPSSLAALLWAVSIFLFARRCYDTRTAWHATLFMASSLLINLVGRAAAPESLANLFLTLTLLNIYKFYHTGNKRYVYWLFMFAGLGVLTKGTAAILIPFAVTVVFFGLQKKWHDLIRLLLNPVGLIVFGLIVIPWYLAEFMLHGEAFLSELLLLQKAESLDLNLIGGTLPYYWYPLFLFIGLLPNSGLLLKAVFRIKQLLSDELLKFMFLWALFAFLLLPLLQPRSPFGVAYCCPPLFIIMARAAENLRHFFNLLVWPLLLTILFSLASGLAPYMMGAIADEFARNAVADGLQYFDTFYRLTLGGVILLLASLPFIKPVPLSAKYAVLALLFVSMVNFLAVPIMGNILQQPIKTAGLLAKKEKFAVVTWQDHTPSFNVYAEMLTEKRTPEPGDIFLSKTVSLENFKPYETLYEKHGVTLARVHGIRDR
jgi:4-amino-4-deoxy-L-arabinose transferase-like glycosyltransferase